MKSTFHVCCAAVMAMAVSCFAEETVIAELSLITDTNAVVDVAAGDVTIIDKLSGNRGTVTKPC